MHSGKIFDNIPESPHTEELREFLLKEEKDLANIDKKLVLNEKQYTYQKEKESYLEKSKFEGIIVCMILIPLGMLTYLAYEELQ